MTSAWPDCGTVRAYGRHFRHREKPCAPCRKAGSRARAELREHGPKVRETAPHGTTAAARAHYRRGEKPCADCITAQREAAWQRYGWEPGSQSADTRPRRNGLQIVPYQWQARTYPWAVRVLANAEAAWGRPEDEEAA